MDHARAARRWDTEYRSGRYAGEPPLPFVGDILSTLRDHPAMESARGLYIGCGNGRNYLPLIDAGVRLIGLDLSLEALWQLRARRPKLPLVCGDFRDFPGTAAFSYVVAIQVFQHGDAADVARYFANVKRLLAPGGLLFLRVNSVSTEIFHAYTLVERVESGGITIRYDAGPKRDMLVHFFSRDELCALAADGFDLVLPPREERITRTPPQHGFWAQWETIWRRHLR
jgi:SAM-dependent methyltransferase